jgi:hypothetical protein
MYTQSVLVRRHAHSTIPTTPLITHMFMFRDPAPPALPLSTSRNQHRTQLHSLVSWRPASSAMRQWCDAMQGAAASL